MYFTKTFTFKTHRRKAHYQAILVWLFILSLTCAETFSLPCPEHCDCIVSHQGLASYKTASCDDVKWNATVFPNIRVLKMKPRSSNQECTIPQDWALVFPNLMYLNLSNCSLSSISANNFRYFKNLQTIDLSHNHLRDLDRFTFASNRLLRYVTLEDNPLNKIHSSFLESTSIDELNIASCQIDKVPLNMFKALINLRHLTISNNKLKTLKDNTLPDNLRTLDLSKNKIVNVPTNELARLPYLTQIDLSENPVNCTCALVGFQDWVSGKGVIFLNNIKCAYPEQYVGYKLIIIPQYEICDAKVKNEGPSSKECSGNQICTNGIVTDDGFVADQPTEDPSDTFKQDDVFPAESNIHEADIVEGEGSGDDINEDNTEVPWGGSNRGKTTPKSMPEKPKIMSPVTSAYNKQLANSGETKPETSIRSAELNSTHGVIQVKEELNSSPIYETTPYSSDEETSPSTVTSQHPFSESGAPSLPPSVENESPPNTHAETSQQPSSEDGPLTKGETTLTESHKGGADDSHSHERLQTQNGGREMTAYIVPGLAIVLIGLICMAVYGCQYAKKARSPKRYKPSSVSNSEGSEMQEVSLLPDNGAQPEIIKYNSKYPNEKDNNQSERLMDESEGVDGKPEVKSNKNQHWEDDVMTTAEDSCKLLNGKSGNGQIANGKNDLSAKVECKIAKVTTLTDSIPKTPIIRNL